MLIKIESIRCPDVTGLVSDAFGIAVRILRNTHDGKKMNPTDKIEDSDRIVIAPFFSGG